MFETLPQNWVGDWAGRRASLTPDRTALIDRATGRRYTYAAIEDRANRTARLLREYDVRQGKRVAVVSRNRPTVFDLFFAAGKTGGVLAPLSHRLAPPELGTLLDVVDPSLLVVEEPFKALVESALVNSDSTTEESSVDVPGLVIQSGGGDDDQTGDCDDDQTGDCDDDQTGDGTDSPAFHEVLPADDSPVSSPSIAPDDPAMLLHTGGSTGTPKETIVSHRSILWNSFNTITAWGLREDDVTPLTFPTFHTGGWNVISLPLFHMGGTVILDRSVDAADLLATIQEEAATVLVAVPAVLRKMANDESWSGIDLSSLRFVKSGGGPCRESVMRAWWGRDVDLSQGYGLTECGPNNFAMPEEWPREKADSVGKPVVHADARVVNEAGTPVETGEVGELQLRGPHAADGYRDRDAETAATFGEEMAGADRTPDDPSETAGWVSTGDLARRDAEGFYSIVGRTKDMFVSGGENVYPSAVEDVLTDHPKIEDAVVVPIVDEEWGEVGKAVVVGDETCSIEELRAFCEDRLARYKHPRALAVVEELPTSGPAKIDRAAVRREHGDRRNDRS